MSLFRVLLAIILPPLAVLDKGCGSNPYRRIADYCRMDSGDNRCAHHPEQELKHHRIYAKGKPVFSKEKKHP